MDYCHGKYRERDSSGRDDVNLSYLENTLLVGSLLDVSLKFKKEGWAKDVDLRVTNLYILVKP